MHYADGRISSNIMITFFKKLQMIFSRDARNLYTIREFGHVNKNLLIIVADPKTDRIYAMHGDRFVNGRIKDPTGKKSRVVKDVLKYSQFHKTIDQYITSLMETLHLPILKGNHFFKFIDGAIFNIAKSSRKNSGKGIPSPFMGSKVEKT